jgi:Fe2+ or Zn2+ uptake regulation protein
MIFKVVVGQLSILREGLVRMGRNNQKAELRQRLGEHGYHLTRQRAAVFNYLSQAKTHPTAEEVFMAVKRRLPRISLATVYKNLEALVKCGLATKLTYGNDSARYDIRTDPHHHTRCLSCGTISDIDLEPDQEDFLKKIKPQPGFEVKEHRVELVGYCRQCRK